MRKATDRSRPARSTAIFPPPPGPSNASDANLSPTHRTAFTKVELLVVITVFFLWGLLLIPCFARTRVSDHTFQCMNNLRVLINAWQMYADDNSDRIMMNTGVSETQSEVVGQTFRNWANNIVSWDSNPMNTNVNLLLRGPMAAYLRSNVTVFKCPADNYVSASQRFQGWTARTRSYSMNGFWGPYNSNPVGSSWSVGRNTFLSDYRQWLKRSGPSNPAGSFVMTDEHPDSINDGYFLNNPVGASMWGDLPASLHNSACNITFADGHIETHLWRGAATRVPMSYFYSSRNFDALGSADYRWLMERTAVRY